MDYQLEAVIDELRRIIKDYKTTPHWLAITEAVANSIREVVSVSPVVVYDPVVLIGDPTNGPAKRRILLKKAVRFITNPRAF